MTFINRKRQTSFLLLILLVSQLCIGKTHANSIQEIHTTSFKSTEIIAAEIAVKPAVSSPETVIRFQYQLMFTNISSVPSFKNTALGCKQNRFSSAQAHISNTFLFNRVLRI